MVNCPACGFDTASCRCDSDPEAVAVANLATEFLLFQLAAIHPDPNRCRRCAHVASAHLMLNGFGGGGCLIDCKCRVFVGGYLPGDPQAYLTKPSDIPDDDVEDYGG